MADVSTKYMGLTLKNPLIAGSSGLTSRVESVIDLEKHGAAAVVLKSLFEEDLVFEMDPGKLNSLSSSQSKPGDFIGSRSRHARMDEYLLLIDACKKSVDIPVIASINCISSQEWTPFARRIEEAGADALELNMFILPSDPMRNSEEIEKVYFEILTDLRKQVKFPVAVKISPYFSGLTKMALKLSWTGIQGMVLFNRYYYPDIDIDKLSLNSGRILSSPDEIFLPLRWIAMLSDRVLCDIAGSTGVYDAGSLIKYMLAGAKAVQITSCLYQNGFSQIGEILKDLDTWMVNKEFSATKDFIGSLSLKKAENPAEWERFQYLQNYNREPLLG